MGHLVLENLRKSFGSAIAVENVTLSVDRGERVALLGPSGCGKTTTLNMVAGFLEPDSGDIYLGGQKITERPAHLRNTGMVFQQYALFPHLNVADNVAFGLKMRRVSKSDSETRVKAALERVRLAHLSDRYPQQLSGGQQQRVALARAIVFEPPVLLLDEPLSNLDAKLRQEMRTELLQLLQSIDTTTIIVTHDQEEALALADRIVVMNGGTVEQIGSPEEVFERPNTPFVAKFLGDPNVLTGIVSEMLEGVATVTLPGGSTVRGRPNAPLEKGQPVTLLVRCERVRLGDQGSGEDNSIAVQVENIIYLGTNVRYVLERDGQRIAAVEQNLGSAARHARGSVVANWRVDDTFVFPVSG
jgi:ABC-type Fe3+/spermidine/putrescine transport system ATPase subunit